MPSPRWKSLLALVLGLAGCDQKRPALFVDSRFLDLGEVRVNADNKIVIPVTLENRGTAPVDIVDFQTSCSCSSIEPRKLVIAPDDDASVTLVVNAVPFGPSDKRASQTPLSIQFSPVLSDGSLAGVYTCRAEYRRCLSLSRSGLDFGRLSYADRPVAQALKIYVEQPHEGLDVAYPKYVDGDLTRRSTGVYVLTARFTPPEVSRVLDVRDNVIVTVRLAGDAGAQAVKIPIIASVLTNVVLEPSLLQFTSNAANLNATRAVIAVSSHNSRPMRFVGPARDSALTFRELPNDKGDKSLRLMCEIGRNADFDDESIHQGVEDLVFEDADGIDRHPK
jgi:hypothetical protein